MTQITLNLSPELEAQLIAAAAKQGVEPGRYVVEALQGRLQQQPTDADRLSQIEADLLQQINLGISSEDWGVYHMLLEKRQAETLTPEEHTRLLAMSDRIEALNVERMQALIRLSQLRGDSLQVVMEALGINPVPYV
ncbi:MAG: hypothetical protein F6J95_006475 [Leptolyngbya sp. SIO1E4]|nr:hypothetical protein [Leptolyngbya sp. SIO1E4]